MKQDMKYSGDLDWVKRIANLMDSKFRIPGTSIKFGLDPIFGLMPVVGDLGTMVISLLLVFVMFRNGASGKLVAKMILNVLIDALFGSIPVLGTFFDVYYKANDRNVRLLTQYYEEDRHKGSATGIVLLVLLILIMVVLGLIYLLYWLLQLLQGALT